MDQKQQLRTKYRLLRHQVSDKATKSAQIFECLISLSEYQQAKHLALYASLPDEVATDEIIHHALAQGKNVYLPKLSGSIMHFYQIHSLNDLVEGAHHIREPQNNAHFHFAPDLIIVPGLCFDHQRNRLGMGGGYYDRYLAHFPAPVIALAFDAQISATPLPTDRRDIKMDRIITETTIID